MYKVYLLFFILTFYSCDKNAIETDFPFQGDGTQIEIYLLKEEADLNYKWGDELSFNDLEEIPWLTHDEIEFYDWSSHSFYLKNDRRERERGSYFVICADKKPLLTGFFYSMFMSSIPPFPSIMAESGLFYPPNIISLNLFHFSTLSEIESMVSSLRIAMENSGLLREGIKVELLGLERVSATKLAYTYKVTNLDTENIYVLDPDRMGGSRFHYYTNGVTLRKNNEGYYSENLESTASDEIMNEWYYRLAPGQSMARTVSLDGFLSLPEGNVQAYFRFPSPESRMERDEWKRKDGRIWLGNIRIEKEMNLN